MTVNLGQPGVFLPDHECAVIDRALREGLAQLAVRNGAVPAGVEQVAAAVHEAALRFRTSVPGSGTAPGVQTAPPAASAPDSDWLTAREVAERHKVSDGYVRRLARERRLVAWPGSRGMWICDASSVAAWAAKRHPDP